ncbi:MAG TPA: P-II family nitrogen regulator [Elusimicrobiota bacterium]|jgi:nitrogen regulatory protein PII|nr:P-II family nitrogen regulator [Elusimicrobiota bacterium]
MAKTPKLQLITAVVRQTKAEAVLAAALKAGAPGITYTWARGTGVRQNMGYAGTLIESEKQVLWIVTSDSHVEKVLESIVKTANIDMPGEGFAFLQPVDRVIGFVPAKGPKA